MENPELLLLEIEEFNRSSGSEDDQIPQNLENFIEFVSKTGTYIFPWNIVKKLFLRKLNSIICNLQACMCLSTSDLNASASSGFVTNQNTANDANSIQLIKDRIVERMKSFTNAPFTIQRICELLLKPNNHYNRADKYLRGLEKCIMVVTTVDPNGNKIFMENMLTNGLSSNPSTPLITPTRPITPEAASGDLSNLTTPVKDDQEIPLAFESNLILKPVIEPKSNEEAIELEAAKPDIEDTNEEIIENSKKILVEEETPTHESENVEIANNHEMDSSVEMDQVTENTDEDAAVSSSDIILSNPEMTVSSTEMEITKPVVSNSEMIVSSTDVILSTEIVEKVDEELKSDVTSSETRKTDRTVEENRDENKDESTPTEPVE